MWALFAASSGQPTDPTLTITQWVVQLGLSGVFLFLYWNERKRGDRLQAENSEIAKSAYPLLATVGKVLETVERGMSATAQRVAPEATNGGFESLRRELAAIRDELTPKLEERARQTRRGPAKGGRDADS